MTTVLTVESMVEVDGGEGEGEKVGTGFGEVDGAVGGGDVLGEGFCLLFDGGAAVVEEVVVDEAVDVVDLEVATKAEDVVEVADGELVVAGEEEDGGGFDAVQLFAGEGFYPVVGAAVVVRPVVD